VLDVFVSNVIPAENTYHMFISEGTCSSEDFQNHMKQMYSEQHLAGNHVQIPTRAPNEQSELHSNGSLHK
jgi:hypothetical protein